LEVQVPFLQVRNPAVSIVPVCLGRVPLADLLAIGETLAGLISEDPAATLVVASSDMSHYEPGEVAREKDRRALDQVEAVDPEGLYRVVREGRISMCGVLPAVVMLAAARRLGLRSAELTRYGNSGDITGDTSAVVGYAGAVIWADKTA
jgi:AmmeMemoRadiSam system protein B